MHKRLILPVLMMGLKGLSMYTFYNIGFARQSILLSSLFHFKKLA